MTGRSALHTGLDYQAATGSAILAAAGGMVVAQEFHPEYGNMIEILIDFNSSLHRKDDQAHKPIDLAYAYANANAK